MSRKKVSTTVYLDADQVEKLKLLNQQTKVSVAEWIRQGVDLILDINKTRFPGQLGLFEPPEEQPEDPPAVVLQYVKETEETPIIMPFFQPVRTKQKS